MAKPGQKKQTQTPPPPKVNESNPPETTIGEQAAQAETLTSNTWLYHETEEPRVFPAGSVIPEGWQRAPRFDDFTWSQVNETEWGKGSRAKWVKRERERKG